MWDNTTIRMLLVGVGESLYMAVFSALFGYVIGLPFGILLVISTKDGIHPNAPLYKVFDVIVNITHSIPFLILMVMAIPLTRLIVGISLGSTATIVPLTLSTAPSITRTVESSLMEIDKGMIEAAHPAGASDQQIIFKVLLLETVPSLINEATIVIATILEYPVTTGFIGGGRLGAIAVNCGCYHYRTDIMLAAVALLVIVMQTFQEIGTRSAGKSDRRKS